MGEIVANDTFGTITSFLDGLGETIEILCCFVAIKSLVSELGSTGHFRLEESRAVGSLLEHSLALTLRGLDTPRPKVVSLLPNRGTWAF